MTPTVWLVLILALSGPATYGYMKVREIIVVKSAVTAERNKGVEACNVRVGKIESENRRSTAQAAEEAERAAGMIPDTPEGKELVEICKRSASCRSRGTL